MATTNGIDPGDAHAAVDDVKTLLKLAKLMEEKVPEVFYSALASGNKKRVIELLSENLFLNYGEVKYKDRMIKRTPRCCKIHLTAIILFSLISHLIPVIICSRIRGNCFDIE